MKFLIEDNGDRASDICGEWDCFARTSPDVQKFQGREMVEKKEKKGEETWVGPKFRHKYRY